MPDHQSAVPLLQAVVLCDCVYSDTHTGKKVIAGTFNTLWGHEFPTVFARSTFVYLCLTEVHHTATMELRYVDLSTNEVLLSLEGLAITADSPLVSVELALQVPPLPMPHPGPFVLEVHAAGTLIGAVRIHVQQLIDPASSNGHAK